MSVSLITSDEVSLAALYYPTRSNPVLDRPGIGAVLAHGFTGSARNRAVRAISTRLQADGIGVLAPDLRGHGRSGGLSTVGDREIADVAAGVAWLRQAGYGAVAVLGWSMGGSIVLRYAGLGGDCDAVVSVSSPGFWYERGTRPMQVVHWLCETRSGRLAARLGRGTRLDPTGWTPVPRSPVDVVADIAPTPLLLVHGDADQYFPLRHAHLLAGAAPTAELWVEPAMGHAETATGPELVDRIAGWLTAELTAGPESDGPPATVWDDGPRESRD